MAKKTRPSKTPVATRIHRTARPKMLYPRDPQLVVKAEQEGAGSDGGPHMTKKKGRRGKKPEPAPAAGKAIEKSKPPLATGAVGYYCLRFAPICTRKPFKEMTDLEVIADIVTLVSVLDNRRDALVSPNSVEAFCEAARAINVLIEKIEKDRPELLGFAAGIPSWPVNLSPKDAHERKVLARLEALKVGTRSTPPGRRLTRVNPNNLVTKVAMELVRRIEIFREYFKSRGAAESSLSEPLPPSLALTRIERRDEVWPPPENFVGCAALEPFSKRTAGKWWRFGSNLLKALWGEDPALYEACLSRDTVAVEGIHPRESERRKYAMKHIRQAFCSLAPADSPPPKGA